MRRLSGLTLEPSTASRGVESWISSLAASRAKTCPSPVEVPGSTANGPGFGLKWSELLGTFDPVTSSWRTSQCSLFEDLTEFVLALPRSGSMRSGQLFERPTLGRLTGASVCSYLRGEYPTPSATRYGSSQNNPNGDHYRPSNGTPSLDTWAKGWSTPNAHDGRRPGADMKSTQGRNLSREAGQFGHPDPTTPKDGEPTSKPADLNPEFVEALMGWPTGWTGLD